MQGHMAPSHITASMCLHDAEMCSLFSTPFCSLASWLIGEAHTKPFCTIASAIRVIEGDEVKESLADSYESLICL